jgi:TonB family protein
MIGDDHAPADPLIKLIGRSLSAHFRYPRMAGELGIRGRVIVELTLHPEGYYSDVQMLKSSDNEDLDAAALYAVNSAPDVIGADHFISKPKHFVIGFVFN